ncbi:hypothetical protein PLICRDRAFT_467078 [Plicaturopsis crispa FD-325 SS-3]|nr:hypothetical protein PLICRDRAFT_467078 [Plicaturopsis crispa FD-325 SS-3]
MASHPMDETRRSVDISSGQPMVIEDSSGAVPNAPGLSPVQPPSTPSSPSFGAAIPDRPTASIVHTPPSQLNGPAPLFRVNFPRIRVNVAGSSSGVDSLFKNALGPRSTSGFSSRPQSQSHSVASSRSLPQTPSVLSSPPAQEATPSTQVQPLSPAAAVKAVEQANGFPLNDGPSLLHDASTTVASANLAQERRRSMPTVHGLPPPPRPTKTRAIMTGSLVDVLNRRHTLNGNIDVTIVDLTKSDDDDDSNNSLDGDSDGFDLGQFETRLKRIDAHSISSGTKSGMSSFKSSGFYTQAHCYLAPAASNDVSTHATPSSKSVDTLDLASNAATAAPKLTAANPPIPRLDSLRDLMKKRKNRKSSGTLNVTAVPPFAVRPAHPSPIGNQPTQTSTSSSHAAVASVSQQEARGPDAQAGPSAQGPGPSTVKTIPSGTTTPGRLPAVSPPSSAVKNAIIAEQTPDGGVGAPDVDDDEDECAQMLLDPDKSDLEVSAALM